MSVRQSNSRQSSNPSASIFAKQRAPIPTKDLNLPSISVIKPLNNNYNKTSIQEKIEPDNQEEPEEMYQNPYHGHFDDENLGHEHIPGEFDKPEENLQSEEQVEENKDANNKGAENVFEDEDFEYQDQGASQLSEGGNVKEIEDKGQTRKKPSEDQGRMSRKIFDSKIEKPNIETLPENTKSVRGGGGIEIYDLPGNTRFDNITINTQQIVEKTNKESVRLSALISNANPNNNKQPLLSIVMSPQQQEIYYKMFYLKANTSVGIKELAMVTKRDQKWFAFMEERAGKMKEKLRDESKILNYMIESVIKLRKHYDSSQETLLDQRKKLYHMACVIMTRKAFEEKLRFEMDYLRHKIEESQDIEKEADLLIAIFSTLSDEGTAIRTSVINEIEHKDIHSLALKKYDEFHDYVNKLDLALQDYRKYYRLDVDSDEFKRKVQSLLAVLTECDDYSRRTFQEIRALNQRITRELQFLIDKLKTSNFDYQSFFGDLEDSSNIVSRLIYIRREKLPNILQKFDEIDQDLSNFNRENSDNQKVFAIVEAKLKSLRKELKGLKKLAKNLRDDPKSQLFINFRLKQTQTLVLKLKNATNRCNAYLLLITYLKENLNRMLNHITKILQESDIPANNSHEEKNRILSEIITISQVIEKQLTIADLKKIDQIFKQFLHKLSDKYEKISSFKPLSIENKQLLKAMKEFKDTFVAFGIEREAVFKTINGKLDSFDFRNEDFYEKNLGLQVIQIQKKARVLLKEEEKFINESSNDFETNQELMEIQKDLNDNDHFCEFFSDTVLYLVKLKLQISSLSFSTKDFSVFSEILQQAVDKLVEITDFFRQFQLKPLNWDRFFAEVYDFLKIFKMRLSSIKSEEVMAKSFDKGLLAFLNTKTLKMNRYVQEFTKDWDLRFKSMNELKSLGSRASTVKELDERINRKRLGGLKSWLRSDDLLEVLVFKEYVKNSEPKNKKLNEELYGLETRIREFYQEAHDFLNVLETNEIPELINNLKNLLGVESQDFEVMLNIYKKALETQEMLKIECAENLGETLKVSDERFKDDLIRFNEEIRGIYENNKKEIVMIIDTLMNKGLHEKMQREMKGFFVKLEENYYESNGFSLKYVTEFVEFSYLLLNNRELLTNELALMREVLIEFKEKNMELASNWEFLQPSFTKILRILSAFCQKDIEDLIRNAKKNKVVLFFNVIESLDEVKEFIKTNMIEKWFIIWKEIFDIVAERKANDVRFIENVKQLKKKIEEGEYKAMDDTGVLQAFLDVLII